MFDTILGLPAHALIVHGAVVLAPVFAILALAYAVVPRIRGKLDWAVVLTGIGAPAAVFAAKQSGERFQAARFPGQVPPVVVEHSSFANPLIYSTLGLAVAALILVFVTRPRQDVSGGGSAVIPVALSVITVILAVVVGYFAVRAGHSGATAVWS